MITIVDNLGITRYLGNTPAPLRFKWNDYGSVPNQPLIPRSEWKPLIDAAGIGQDHPFLPPVHDQNGYGMCNASATVAAGESCRLVCGLPHVSLSGGDLYNRICGGADNGSLLEDGIREAMSRGLASTAVTPYLQWQRRGANADQDAARFKVLEAYLCPTFDHCMSAVLCGFKLISGIMWYSNYTPGSDGWLPRPQGQAGGHAVFGYKATYRGDEFGIWHQNSWKASWGLRGCCVFPESSYRGPVGGWWAVRAMVAEDGDIPTPRS